MSLNVDNAKRIDLYIQERDCKKNGTEPVFIQDERQDLDVFRLPLDHVFFNIRNGRFAAEYKELVQNEGRELHSDDEEDSKKIQKLLLDQDKSQTKILEEDLERFGQRDPGIITWDGYLVNGNRRMAVLKRLKEESGNDKFGYLEVARLPKGVSEQDVWKIEAGIQLSRHEKLDYGPVNTLLKLKEGKEAGLTPKQIASSLYGGFDEEEIAKSLDRLKLIDQYLEYIGKPKMYSKIKVHEHFIPLQDIITAQKNVGLPPEDLLKMQKIAFELIRTGVKMLDIRKIRNIMKYDKSRNEFLTAAEHLPTLTLEEEEGKEQDEDEDDEDDYEESPVKTIFYDSVDISEAKKKEHKPLELLSRAFSNLDAIDLTSEKLLEQKSKDKIKNIIQIVDKLKSLIR